MFMYPASVVGSAWSRANMESASPRRRMTAGEAAGKVVGVRQRGTRLAMMVDQTHRMWWKKLR